MTKNTSLFSEVDILINGKPVKKYSHNGRVFIEAKEGTEYTIRVKNNSWPKKLANVSVDGINVVNGEAAGKANTGYILQGYNSYEVKGFRTSNDAVNIFKFAAKKQSYAAKSEETKGDTTNCGVIGVKFYSEKLKPAPVVIREPIFIERRPIFPDPWENPWKPHWTVLGTNTSDSAVTSNFEVTSTFGPPSASLKRSLGGGSSMRLSNCVDNGPVAVASAGADIQALNFCATVQSFDDAPRGFDLGTEFSDKEITDKVNEVEFEIGELESEFEIFYASRESLIQMGVKLEKEAQVAFPSAFPSKFCKPPKK